MCSLCSLLRLYSKIECNSSVPKLGNHRVVNVDDIVAWIWQCMAAQASFQSPVLTYLNPDPQNTEQEHPRRNH